MEYLCCRCGGKKVNHRKGGMCIKCYNENRPKGDKHPRWNGSGICPECGGKKANSSKRRICRQCWFKKPKGGDKHWNFGKHWTLEVRMKISKANTGKRMGSENNRWNPHKIIRRDYRLPDRLWREAILARDGGKCRVCGAKSNIAHHIERYSEGQENDQANGITLCDLCHRITFGREQFFVAYFKEKLKNASNSAEPSEETTPSQQERLREALWACVTVSPE